MRGFFSGDLNKEKTDKQRNVAHFHVRSEPLSLDIDNDGLNEFYIWEKIDGRDFFVIKDINKKVLGRYELDNIGLDAWLYRISLRDLGKGIKAFILMFYEGKIEYLKFRSVSRLHFITFKDADITSFNHFKGPPIWHEFEDGYRHYHQREYPFLLKDYNNDGIKEIKLQSGQAQWVYMFDGKKSWIKF